MSPKPERKRPPASTPVRGRLTAQPEQLRVGDQQHQQHPEGQTSEVPDSQTSEPGKPGLWGRLADMASRDNDAEGPAEPAAPPAANPRPSGVPQSQTPAVPQSGTPGLRQPPATRAPESRTPRVPESVTPEPPESQTPALPDTRTPRPTPAARPQTTETRVPRYLTLTRTEARLRDDQLAALAVLRRRVAANRTDKAERFTDNTLLRVAVDLLLENGDRLHGDTEDALRASLGIAPKDDDTQSP